ncbi:MAG: methyltransferase domain-containing protein, partial [Hyphomicrobiales bacterium]|nr:methyltransferase domain-containing protein [Hyphomicrobiales bacterium]
RDLDWIDVGCGNGAFTAEVMRRSSPRTVLGVDPSDGQIAYAKSRDDAVGARFEIGDAMDLPARAAAFDVATMALVLAFVPDPQKGAAELARVLRPGGIAAAYMWALPGGAPIAPLWQAMAEIGVPVALPPSAHWIEPERMSALWTGAGLRRVEATTLRIDVEFEGVADYWEIVTAPGGPRGKEFAEMAPDAKGRLRARLDEILVPGADGSVRFRCRAHAVKGVA